MLVVLFVTTVVSNVWGVLTIGVPDVTLAMKRGAKLRAVFHPMSAISDPLYSIELSLISLFRLVGAVLAIV